jgi:putative transposase
MQFDPFKHHRRSIRLKGYDYSQEGAYYVTIVTQHRFCLFGDVVNDEMRLSDAGRMIKSEWIGLPKRFPNVELDEFVLMPNHTHGIIVITDKMDGTRRATTRVAPTDANPDWNSVGAGLVPAHSNDDDDIDIGNDNSHDPALGEIVGAWKSIVTDEYVRGVRESHWEPFHRKLWQRGYHEHIIRDEKDLARIREYIINNPANWDADRENPNNGRTSR